MAAGQLAASPGAVIEPARSSQHTVSLLLFNTNNAAETVTVQVTPSGGSAQTLFQFTLQASEHAIISNIVLGPNDTLSAQATDASQVNYLTTATSANSPFPPRLQVFDSAGSIKSVVGSTLTAATTITSNSATALAVGRQGTTSPALQVDASTGSCITGVNIKAAASGGGVTVKATGSATEPITIQAAGIAAINLGSTTASSTVFTATPAASGGGFAVSVTGGGTNEALTVDAKGSGTITVGSVSTGNVVIGTSGHTTTFNNTTGAVTILAGGLTVTAGGLTVSASGAAITGNTSVASGTLTSSGGNISLNASSNFNTVINSGTSTGTVTIGNTAAGAVAIASGAASTVQVTGANLTVGTLTSGTTAVVSAGLLTLTGVGASVWTPGAGATIVSDTTTGIKIGTATTQKLGFFNATPVVQPAASSDTTGFTAGSGTASKSDSTWTGSTGSSAYTVGGIVTQLKALGLLAA